MRWALPIVAVGLLAACSSATAADDVSPSNFAVSFSSTPIDTSGQPIITRAVRPGEEFFLTVVVATANLPNVDSPTVPLTGPRSARYSISFAPGVEVLPATPVRFQGASGTSSTCLDDCLADMGDDGRRISVSAAYRLRAAAPGTYAVTVRLTSTNRPDPDPTNDRDATSIRVVAGSSAGAGAFLGGRVTGRPDPPRSGRAFIASVGLSRKASPVSPSKVACSARIAGRAVTTRGAPSAVGAQCSLNVPSGSAGKTLLIRITATTGNGTISWTRSFRIRA